MGRRTRAFLCAVLWGIAMMDASAAVSPQELDEIAQKGQLVTQLRKENKWGDLVQLMPSLIKSFANVPGFHLAYADALREMKRLPEAIENYRIVRRLQPENPWGYNGEGWALMLNGDFNAAEEVVVKGMKVNPNFPSLLHASLVINWMRGNRQLAFERLSDLEQVEPDLAEKVAISLGMRGGSSIASPKAEADLELELLNSAMKKLLDGFPAAAISIISPIYFSEASKRITPLADVRAGDILLIAYAMNGSFTDMISLYGDLSRWTNADEYAYEVYRRLSLANGAADQFAIRALVASVIVSSGTGRLHTGLQRGLDGLLKAKEAGMQAVDEAMLLLAISQTYAFLGRRGDEARAVEQAQALLGENRLKPTEQMAVAVALAGLSKFKRSDFVGAAKDIDDAIESLEGLDQLDTPFGSALLLERAQILVFEKKYDEAVELQRRSLEATRNYSQRLRRTFPKARISELARSAWLSQAFGHFELAVQQLELAAKYASNWLGPESPTMLNAEAVLASAYIRAGKPQEARNLLQLLIPKVEALRTSGILVEEDRQQLFSRLAPSYKEYAWLLVDQDHIHSFEIAELAKARTLLESTLMRGAISSGLLPNEDSIRLRDLENQLSQLTEKISVSRGVGKIDFTAQSNQQRLEAEYRKFRQDLLKRFPRYARLLEFSFPGVKAISSQLSKDETLISYLVTPKKLLIYSVTRDGLKIEQVDVSSIELRRLVEIARSSLSGQPLTVDGENISEVSKTSTDATERSSAEFDLAKYLLAPIRDSLRNKRSIVIAPDEVLASFPFEVLKLDGKRLIETFDVGYSQSASVFYINREKAKKVREYGADILAFGGAVYQRPTSDATFRQQSSGSPEFDLSVLLSRNLGVPGIVPTAFESLRGRWENLPGAEKEVEEVGALFQIQRRKVITGLAASESTLQELNRSGDLRRYKYLLFSTHGYLSLHEPALSAVVLSQVGTTTNADGYVTASEWAGYDLRSELVVLSACDTGVGKVVQGEGVTGLPYALSVAGNNSTVVSLWPVADDSTKTFMLNFFTKIRDGMNIRKALSDTKREFLQGPQFSAPIFWAPFVMYGS